MILQMTKIIGGIITIVVLTSILGFLTLTNLNKKPVSTPSPIVISSPTPSSQTVSSPAPKITVIAKNLAVPWALAFVPDGSLLFTERVGRVRFINKEGILQEQPVAQIAKVKQIGEGGLHGIAIHPKFSENNFVYLYYTYNSSGDNTSNRVVRYKFQDNKLTDEKIIVDQIPGAQIHDGGRLKFGPDNFLYISTGDASEPSLAQDKNSLAGKILRVTDDGGPALGNPFNSRIYSYGHRNPQGLAWDQTRQLYNTEHGQSATDELNKIIPGKNYGWPIIRGTETNPGMESPVLQSGLETWAPGGMAYYNGSFFYGGLRGQALFQATINGDSTNLKTHFKNEFGRIRDVVIGPDNMLYISTSNQDGRGTPKADDDMIIRVNPQLL